MCSVERSMFSSVTSSMVLTFHHATIFLHSSRRVRTFLVLMFLERWRRCPLTAASQLRDERRASFRPPFLGSSSCGANSSVSKEGCLVVLGAVE